MIRTVIFDMDGVIVDTEPVHKYAYFKHFEELNILVSDALYHTLTGNSTRNVFQKLKNEFNLNEDVEDLILRKRSIFNDAFDTKEDLFLIEGVEDLIKDLHANGIQLILASSASKLTIDRVFNRFNLNQYFTHKISGEDFPKSKQHPAIVIEDSTNGIEAAVGANIYCVGYDSLHSKYQDLSKADIIIRHFKEMNAEMVKNLN